MDPPAPGRAKEKPPEKEEKSESKKVVQAETKLPNRLEDLADVVLEQHSQSSQGQDATSEAKEETPAPKTSEAASPKPPSIIKYIKVTSACVGCRKSRVRCEKVLPCGRCRRLGQECMPQLRGRGRPPTTVKGSQSGSEGSAKSGKSKASAKVHPAKAKSAMKRKASVKLKKPPTKKPAVEPEAEPKPKLKMRGFEVLVRTFNRLIAEGRHDPASAVNFTRFWAYVSSRVVIEGLKASTKRLAKVLGVSLDDIYSGSVANRDPLRAAQYIPANDLKSLWDSSDAAFIEQTVVDGEATSVYCNELFSRLFFPSNRNDRRYRDFLSEILHEKDVEEVYNTLGETLFTSDTAGGGRVVKHVVRFKVRSSATTMLGLLYHHSFVSLNGSIARFTLRIIPLPSSKALSKIKHIVSQPCIIPLTRKMSPMVPGTNIFENVPNTFMQQAMANMFQQSPMQYGALFGMPMAQQLAAAARQQNAMYSQQQLSSSSTSPRTSLDPNVDLALMQARHARSQGQTQGTTRSQSPSMSSVSPPAEPLTQQDFSLNPESSTGGGEEAEAKEEEKKSSEQQKSKSLQQNQLRTA